MEFNLPKSSTNGTYPTDNFPGNNINLGVEDNYYSERQVECNYSGIQLVDGRLGNMTETGLGLVIMMWLLQCENGSD